MSQFLFLFNFFYKGVELVSGGFVINRAYPIKFSKKKDESICLFSFAKETALTKNTYVPFSILFAFGQNYWLNYIVRPRRGWQYLFYINIHPFSPLSKNGI